MKNGKSNFGFLHISNMEKFEVFHQVISSSKSFLFLKSAMLVYIHKDEDDDDGIR